MTVQVPDAADGERCFVPTGVRPECPQLCLLRLDGSIWFGAVNHIRQRLREQLAAHPRQKHLLLLMDGVNFVDVAGAELLAQEAERRRRLGGELYFDALKSGVCAPLTQGDYFREIGAENTFDRKSEALAQIVENLEPTVCATCDKRIFRECTGQPGPTAMPNA